MMKNNSCYSSGITYVIFTITLVILTFFSLSCATNRGASAEGSIPLDTFVGTDEKETSVSFDEEIFIPPLQTLQTFKTLENSEAQVDSDMDITLTPTSFTPSKENDETVRFVYINENGEDWRQEVKTKNSSTLLEEQFSSNVETVKTKRDFFNSIVEYSYSDGKIYDCIVSPLSVTDIRLEENEVIAGNIAIGDAESFTIETTTSVENGKDILHILIRAEYDEGQTTLILPTNRRTYYFRLVATKRQGMVGVRFKYRDKSRLSYSLGNLRSETSSNTANGSSYSVDANALFFGYVIEGSSEVAPQNVFSNDKTTFFQFDPLFQTRDGAPSLYLKNGNTLSLINYTIRGNLYSTSNLLKADESFVFIEGNERAEVYKEGL